MHPARLVSQTSAPIPPGPTRYEQDLLSPIYTDQELEEGPLSGPGRGNGPLSGPPVRPLPRDYLSDPSEFDDSDAYNGHNGGETDLPLIV